MDNKFRDDIQALRGIAVVSVVLFHANEHYFPLGYLGVDIFFVISGYVVTPLIFRIFSPSDRSHRLTNLKYFFKGRFLRLAPAFGATLSLSVIAMFLLISPAEHENFVRQGIASLLLLGNFGAFRYSGDYFSPNINPLVHTWSLAVEMQIYIILPTLFMFLVPKRSHATKRFATTLALITLISFVMFTIPTISDGFYSLANISLGDEFSFYSPINRVWQFTLGGLLFILMQSAHKLENFRNKRVNFLIIIIMLTLLFGQVSIYQKFGSIIATFITILLISFNSLRLLPVKLMSILKWVGDRSYSIYLIHLPLIYIAKFSPNFQIGNGSSRGIQVTISLAITVFLGTVSYSRIEKRFRLSVGSERLLNDDKSFASMITLVTPLILLLFMQNGLKNEYWGLMNNPTREMYAGNQDPECLRDSVSGPPCYYINEPSEKTVLLIGDSNAGHLSQAVIDASKRAKWNAVVWAHSGCLVNFQIENQEISNSCTKINNEMKLWVLANKPDAIVVAQFMRVDSPVSDIKDALSSLKVMVPQILLVENIPILPPDLFNRSILTTMLNRKAFTAVSEDYLNKVDKEASDDLAEWARSKGISTINLGPLFCKNSYCEFLSDSEWLYIDNFHLSEVGANRAVPQLIEFLDTI